MSTQIINAVNPRHRVFVVGVGMTKFTKPGSTGDDYPEFVQEAVTTALKDSKLKFEDIKQACAGYVYGDSTCGQRALYEIGMSGIPVYNVNNNCSTGSTALLMGFQLVEGGVSDCVLVFGFEKMVRGSLSTKFDDRTNPIDKHVQVLASTYGISAAPFTPQLFGAAGKEHMEKYGTKPEQFAKIAWKNHKHSTKNPYSQFRDEYSLEQILKSPVIYDPLTKLQCCPTSDGAAAVILASEKFMKEHGLERQAVEILGMEMATDLPSSFNENSCIKMIGFDMTRKAANNLFQKTNKTPKDVDVVELHDCFSVNELITYEALGLCEIGKGGELVDSGNNTYGGKYVINPSGGLISKGHPLGATGVAQCIELCWHLRNEAGERQVPGAKLALQHNLGLGGAAVVALYQIANPGMQASPGKPSLTLPPAYANFKSAPFFEKLQQFMTEIEGSLDKNIKGSVKFTVTSGSQEAAGIVTFKDGKVDISFDADAKSDCTVIVPDSVLVDVLAKKLDLRQAVLSGKAKIKGNISLLMKLMPLTKFLSKL